MLSEKQLTNWKQMSPLSKNISIDVNTRTTHLKKKTNVKLKQRKLCLKKTNVELRKRLSKLNKTNVEVEKRIPMLNKIKGVLNLKNEGSM